MYSDSKSGALDHSIFNDSDSMQGRHSARSGGGGGIAAAPSSNAGSGNSSTQGNRSESTEDGETDEEATRPVEEEPEEVEEQLVKLTNALFLTPDTAKIDSKTEVQVDVEYLTDREPKEISFQVHATYKDEVETGPFVTASIKNGVSKASVTLVQHMGYYNAPNKTATDKIKYTFKALCDQDDTELESDELVLPDKVKASSLIEIQGGVFNTNGVIPCLDVDGALLSALCKTYRYFGEWPDKEMVIFSHTDVTNESQHNFDVSEKRAQAVKALLTNDESLWKNIASADGTDLDCQSILKTLVKEHGWSIDSEVEDGAPSDSASFSLVSFKEKYNQKFEKNIAVDDSLQGETWPALLDVVYALALQGADVSQSDVHLQFFSENNGLFPCGELCPKESIGLDGLKSTSDRRVEIHFHDTPNAPQLPKPAIDMETKDISSYDQSITEIEILTLERAILSNWDIEVHDDDDDEAEYEVEVKENTAAWDIQTDDADDDDDEAEYKVEEKEAVAAWDIQADDDDDDDDEA